MFILVFAEEFQFKSLARTYVVEAVSPGGQVSLASACAKAKLFFKRSNVHVWYSNLPDFMTISVSTD